MDALPCELLVDIFSFVDIGQFLELRQVCIHWQTIIDERPGIWRRKRTITEANLGAYLSFESKVIRLIYFLKNLPSIDYYFFPVLMRERIIYSIPKETYECLKQLYVLLKALFREGRIPVHLDAVNFIENMSDLLKRKKNINTRHWKDDIFEPSCLESACSIAKCRSIIVPVFPYDKSHLNSYDPWTKYLVEKMGTNLEEIVIEKMNTHSYAVKYGQPWPSLQVATGSAIYGPSRVRVLSVASGDHDRLYSFPASVRLRPDRQLFTYNDFARLLDKLPRLRKEDGLMLFLEKLQSEGRVEDCQIAPVKIQMSADGQPCCFIGKKVDSEYQDLLLRMANSTINHLAVRVFLPRQGGQPASSPLDFLRADPFRGVTRLDIDLSLSSADKSSNAGLVHAWNCLLQDDILTRLKFLRVSIGDWFPNSKRGSRMLAAPLRTTALPRLESLHLRDPGSIAHLCSLLRGTPNLRCLRLNMYDLTGDRSEREHVALRDMLLAAISPLTSLVSLSIELEKPLTEHRKHTCSWMTRSLESGVHLSEPVFTALSKLIHLDSLAISFPSDTDRFRFYSDSLEHDMQRLVALLPRLRVVLLCNMLLKERGPPSTHRDRQTAANVEQ